MSGENGIYIGSAKDGKVTGFIPRVRPHSTWEGNVPGGARKRRPAFRSVRNAHYCVEAGPSDLLVHLPGNLIRARREICKAVPIQ